MCRPVVVDPKGSTATLWREASKVPNSHSCASGVYTRKPTGRLRAIKMWYAWRRVVNTSAFPLEKDRRPLEIAGLSAKTCLTLLKPIIQTLSDEQGRKTPDLTTPKPKTTLNNGYLGSRNDEERSEM
jgi:hypothetical protein